MLKYKIPQIVTLTRKLTNQENPLTLYSSSSNSAKKENSDSQLPDYQNSLWSGKRDSNPRPSAWEADALPTELLPHL